MQTSATRPQPRLGLWPAVPTLQAASHPARCSPSWQPSPPVKTRGLGDRGPSSHWNVATANTVRLGQFHGGAVVVGNKLFPLPPCAQNQSHGASKAVPSLFGVSIQQGYASHREEAKVQRSKTTCWRQWQV